MTLKSKRPELTRRFCGLDETLRINGTWVATGHWMAKRELFSRERFSPETLMAAREDCGSDIGKYNDLYVVELTPANIKHVWDLLEPDPEKLVELTPTDRLRGKINVAHPLVSRVYESEDWDETNILSHRVYVQEKYAAAWGYPQLWCKDKPLDSENLLKPLINAPVLDDVSLVVMPVTAHYDAKGVK